MRNVLSNWGAFAFAAVVSFMLSPFIVHQLGDTAYGTWALVGAITGYLGLLDLGVRGAVTRYVAQMHAGSRHQDAGRITSAALNLFGVGGMLAVLIAIVLAIFVVDVFKIPQELVGATRIVLVMGGFTIGISLIGGAYGGVVTALQRFDVSSGIDVLVEALRATSVVIALKAGGGIIGLAAVQLGATSLRAMIQFWAARGIYPELRVRLREWDRSELRQIFSFSIYSIFLHVAGMITMSASTIVIGAILPVAMITGFAIAASLISYVRTFGSGIGQTLTPQASALDATGGQDAVRALPAIAARITSLVLLPMIVTLLLRGGTFIGLWMGSEYVATAGPVLVVLSIALWIVAPRNAFTPILMGIGRHRVLVLPYFAEAVVTVTLSILLIGPMGIVGVAWAGTIPAAILTMLIMPWLLKRVLDVPVMDLYLNAWVRPAMAMLPFMAVTYLTEINWQADSLIMYFVQVIACLPAAAMGIWRVGLTEAERARYGRSIVQRLRGRFRVLGRPA